MSRYLDNHEIFTDKYINNSKYVNKLKDDRHYTGDAHIDPAELDSIFDSIKFDAMTGLLEDIDKYIVEAGKRDRQPNDPDRPTKVIFHDPATIAFWNDGTKTVAKCMQSDQYDPEIGLMVCYLKRFAPSSFKTDIKKLVSKEYRQIKRISRNQVSMTWVRKPEH